MTSILFSNKYDITANKFKEMIDKLESVREKTDDYQIISESKRILGRDYYKDAVLWLRLFSNAEWWREDLS